MAASLSGLFNLQVMTSTGAPAFNHRLYTFANGTTTQKTAWTDAAGTVAHAYVSDGLGGLYIALNARGELPAPLFLTTGPYDIALKDTLGAAVWTRYSRGQDDASATADAALRADLASASDVARGAVLVGDSPILNYAARTIGAAVHDIALDVNNISGVDPTGVASSSSALTTFFGLIGSGYVARFRGTYSITGQVGISSKNIVMDCRGATFNLSGDNAGFKVGGTVISFEVYGGRYIGDGINRDANSTKAQAAWIFGNGAADSVQNVKVFGGYCMLTNIGWKFAAGTGPFVKTYNCAIFGAMAFDIRGYAGGVGYGFQFSQADGSSIIGCVADTCQRHGIYFAEGKDYKASNITVTRCGKGDGTIRGSLCISRSAQVTISGVVAYDNADVGIEIDTDAQGTAPDNVMNGLVVTGIIAYGNAYGDVRIGTIDPATDGIPKNVSISGRTRAAAGFSAAPSVSINCGERIKVDIDIDGSVASGSYRAVSLNGSGGATYTKDIEVTGSIDSAGYGIQVASAIQTGTQRIVLKPDRINCAVADYEFISGEDATTNPDMRYFLRNGAKPRRTYSSSGAAVTIPAGGLGVITLTAAGATTIAGFSGLTEGEELIVYATNGNSTLTNSATMQLDGGANIIMTSADILRLQYISGALRQTAKISLN